MNKMECNQARHDAAHDAAHLRDCLRLAVPEWMAELKPQRLPADELQRRAHNAGEKLGNYGDALMFIRKRKKKSGRSRKSKGDPEAVESTQEMFNILAEGLACAALLGVENEKEVVRQIERICAPLPYP